VINRVSGVHLSRYPHIFYVDAGCAGATETLFQLNATEPEVATTNAASQYQNKKRQRVLHPATTPNDAAAAAKRVHKNSDVKDNHTASLAFILAFKDVSALRSAVLRCLMRKHLPLLNCTLSKTTRSKNPFLRKPTREIYIRCALL